MNQDRTPPTDTSPGNGDNIGRLLRMAGPRPSAPHEREARVKELVHDEWRASLRGRRQRLWMVRGGLSLAAAASMLLMVGLLFQPMAPVRPVFDGPIGELETLSGAVTLVADGVSRPLHIGDRIPAGATIDTGSTGRAAVRLASGSSLRLDQGTRLRGLTDSVVELESGGVYLDSGEDGTSDQVEIQTSFGSVRDIGTQFEVRLADEAFRIRVREGSIHLDRDGRVYDAGAGVELSVDSEGELSRRSVAVFGPEWDWILAVAPPFELEGKTLDVFLAWVSRETGVEPRFLDEQVEAGAPEVVLHGSLDDIPPDEALDAVLPTCGLAHRLDGGMVVIQAEGP